jgi:hypothetical protein
MTADDCASSMQVYLDARTKDKRGVPVAPAIYKLFLLIVTLTMPTTFCLPRNNLHKMAQINLQDLSGL